MQCRQRAPRIEDYVGSMYAEFDLFEPIVLLHGESRAPLPQHFEGPSVIELTSQSQRRPVADALEFGAGERTNADILSSAAPPMSRATVIDISGSYAHNSPLLFTTRSPTGMETKLAADSDCDCGRDDDYGDNQVFAGSCIV